MLLLLLPAAAPAPDVAKKFVVGVEKVVKRLCERNLIPRVPALCLHNKVAACTHKHEPYMAYTQHAVQQYFVSGLNSSRTRGKGQQLI